MLMFKYLNSRIGLLCLFASMFSCENQSPEVPAKQPAVPSTETMVKTNRYLVRSEEEDINDMINRYGWQMTKTGSGLRYQIDKKGKGPQAKAGDAVELEYTASLLNGALVLNSAEDGPMRFIVGRGGVPGGIEEGVLLLRQGDEAKFVLPSHLAFGLPGDGKRIPARASLVYKIKLVEISRGTH